LHYNISERPDSVQDVTIKDKGSQWVLIQWTVPNDRNSEIVGYNVYTKSVDSDSNFTLIRTPSTTRKRQANMFTTTTNSYNVTQNILPFMIYQFIVVACNELGCGDVELAQPSPVFHSLSEGIHVTTLYFNAYMFYICI